MLEQALAVHRADLVQDDVARSVLEPARDAKWIRVRRRCEWGDDDGPQVRVQLVGRHDHAGPRLPDLASARGIEGDQVNLAALLLNMGNR